MNFRTLASVFLSVLFLTVASGGVAHAATPTLSLSSATGDSVQITVIGDPNASVSLFYNVGSTSGMQTRSIGTTSPNGILSTVVSTNGYGAIGGSLSYITVNGQQSAMVVWPYVGSGGTGTLTLSQNTLNLPQGQSVTISAYGGFTTLTVTNNSNPSVANFAVNGSQIVVTGNNPGTTIATICNQNNLNNCAALSVTTQTGTGQSLTFGQNNVYLSTGNSIMVSISGGSGSYYISNNSNQSVVQASVSGSSLSLYATGVSGFSTITICSQNNQCGTVTVSVNTSGSGSITFSQNNLFLSSGNTQSVSIFGGSGYYISNNSNQSVASAYLSGTNIIVSAMATGNTTVTVCGSGNACGTLYITVNTGGSGGMLYFSQSNPTVAVSQSINLTVSGGSGSYYISSNSAPQVASVTLSGNNMIIYGSTVGATTATVCSSGNTCGSLYVTVGNVGSGYGLVLFSKSNPVIGLGQTISITLSGGSGSYYLSSTNNTIVQPSINGSILSLYGASYGSSSVTVCSTNGGCNTLFVTVSNTGVTIDGTTDSLLAQIQFLQNQLAQLQAQAGLLGGSYPYGTGSSYTFYRLLTIGSSGPDVSALQQRLTTEGVYRGPITGYYGTLTYAAVAQYQSLHGISPTGSVGPLTRAALNGG
jgi:ferredoxin